MDSDLILVFLFSSFIWVVGVIMGFFVGIDYSQEIDYKQGQIDAINGKIKYELITNVNKEIVWKEIKESE